MERVGERRENRLHTLHSQAIPSASQHQVQDRPKSGLAMQTEVYREPLTLPIAWKGKGSFLSSLLSLYPGGGAGLIITHTAGGVACSYEPECRGPVL